MAEATHTRASGVTVSVDGPAALDRRRPSPRRSVKGARRIAPGASADGGVVLDALAAQDFELVDSIPLVIPEAARPKRRGAAAPVSAVTLDVPLGPGEQAVVLLEDEGEYRWIVPSEPSRSRGAKRRRTAAEDRVRFTIEITAALPPPAIPAKRGAIKRNWLLDQLVGQVTAYVFRFAIGAVGKKVVEFLERKIEQGLVSMAAPDPREWALLDDEAPLPRPLPSGSPARVLLFVHGTFSSTVGSFGALGVVPQGRDFLARVRASHDVVLGFDHATLSVDPLANAKDLLKRLRRIKWPRPPHIDIIAFSRGGLVARSLIEHLLPGSGWKATIGRVAFVGCTNGGTQLAEPDNWHRFADHYTNLALAATRVLSLLPGVQGASTIASGVIRGVGVLVKALASAAITDGAVPGLAAMEPDGAFVTTINGMQPGQPSPANAQYFAVTSDFEAGKALRSGGVPELPPKLLMRIADWGADELYGEPNDLVVHVRSMTQIDPDLGTFVKDTLAYGSNGVVYHTNYFTREDTANKLIEWFTPSGTVPPKRAPKRGPTTKARAVASAAHKRKSEPTTGAVKRAAPAKKAAPIGLETEVNATKMSGDRGADALLELSRKRKPAARSAAGQPVASKKTASKKSAVSPEETGVTEQVECHFRAEMDSEVVVGKTASVDVTIPRHALQAAAGRTGDTATAPVDATKKLIVQIAERRNFRVDAERRVEIDVPEPGDEASVSFDVTGLVAGEEGELWVQVRQGPVPLTTLKLRPRIVASASTRPAPRLPVDASLAAFPAPETPVDEMRIIELLVGDSVQYLYLLDLPSLKIREEFRSPLIPERDTYITRIMARIGDAWAGTGKDQLKAFETDLKSIGAMMFTELMPREMRELLWRQRKRIESVQVFSMEPFIPWELVLLMDPGKAVFGDDSRFFAELGLVRWLYDGYPPSRLTIGGSRARYIIPTYRGAMALPEAAAEKKMLEGLFAASAVTARALDVQKLLRTPGSFDLLHFGGHAEAAGEQQADARLLLDQSDDGSTENALLATTVAQTARLDAGDRRPIVVLNACESARMSRSFASMGGFASAFVSRGAGVFIGTHWSVGDAPARTFIEAFYKSFATRKAGAKPLELREAVVKARRAARDGGDATWLAYVVYGHPRAVVA